MKKSAQYVTTQPAPEEHIIHTPQAFPPQNVGTPSATGIDYLHRCPLPTLVNQSTIPFDHASINQALSTRGFSHSVRFVGRSNRHLRGRDTPVTACYALAISFPAPVLHFHFQRVRFVRVETTQVAAGHERHHEVGGAQPVKRVMASRGRGGAGVGRGLKRRQSSKSQRSREVCMYDVILYRESVRRRLEIVKANTAVIGDKKEIQYRVCRILLLLGKVAHRSFAAV